MHARRLNDQQLTKAMKDGLKRWLSDDEVVRGIGRLVARVTSTGSLRFYFRYCVEGKQRYVPIGPYCHQERDGFFTLAQARARARELSAIHRDPAQRDVRTSLDLDRPRRPATASAASPSNRKDIAVEALCLKYVSERERAGMRSSREVRGLLKRRLSGTTLAAMAARSVTSQDIVEHLRAVLQVAPRDAGKLRSTLSAAYNLASSAALDPSAMEDWSIFGIENNPVIRTAKISTSRARNRNLSARELGLLWMHLNHGQGSETQSMRSIRLTLLLGGQRCRQLLRATLLDVNADERTLTLLDPKGRRRGPGRVHELPLCDAAWREVQALMNYSKGIGSSYLFAGRSERICLNEGTVSSQVRVICDYFFEIGLLDSSRRATKEPGKRRVEDASFCYADFRRTTESRLKELGVSNDLCAHILSHGLSGVQHTHYNRANYLPLKRSALEQWEAFLIKCMDEQRQAYLEAVARGGQAPQPS